MFCLAFKLQLIFGVFAHKYPRNWNSFELWNCYVGVLSLFVNLGMTISLDRISKIHRLKVFARQSDWFRNVK